MSDNIKFSRPTLGLAGSEVTTMVQLPAVTLLGGSDEPGPQGVQGLQGVPGFNGLQGIRGRTGVTGLQGIQGATGKGLDIKGIVQFENQLPYNAVDGDLWVVGDNLYIYDAPDPGMCCDKYPWSNKGPLNARGPQGVQGPNGSSAYEEWKNLLETTDVLDPNDPKIKWDKSKNSLLDFMEYIRGAKGKSAYQLAVAHGYRGTEDEYLISLQGATGAQGITGAQGATGVQGFTGESAYQVASRNAVYESESAWLKSLKGETGLQGATGAQGTMGESAYQVAVRLGARGSETEWISSLQGPKGDLGTQGVQGYTGIQGAMGTQGIKGETGDPFKITGRYETVSALEADFNNTGVKTGEFAVISNEDEGHSDNGRLYLKGISRWEYIMDMSDSHVVGPRGLQGPRGKEGPMGPEGKSVTKKSYSSIREAKLDSYNLRSGDIVYIGDDDENHSTAGLYLVDENRDLVSSIQPSIVVTASESTLIKHDFKRRPVVTAVDSNGEEVIIGVKYIDERGLVEVSWSTNETLKITLT